MRTTVCTLLLLPFVAIGCQQPAVDPETGSATSALLLDGRQYDHFGLGVHDGDVLDVSAVMAGPERYDGQTLRLQGPIHAVCKQAGCWARLSGEDGLFVKMKGHAFFLPLDCEGRQAVLEGRLVIETQSVEEVRHYLEDAGRHDEAARVTEPKREVSFIATGVALQKPAR